MSKRKTILVFIDWFLPGTNAGGPIRSVYSMVKLLKKDFDFKIFTRNTDHDSATPYPNVTPDSWIIFEDGVEVYYCSDEKLNNETLGKILKTECDKIYLNSFYSPWFSIYPIKLIKKLGLQQKVVLAPRGMLGKGARAVKPLKKKLFITYAKFTGLHRNITWHASSESEKKDIVQVFGGKVKIKIAGNLSYIEQKPFEKRSKQKGELKLFFLSRIVPIKNLHKAIEGLSKLDASLKITYDIYGPLEDKAYWEQCEKIIAGLDANKKVVYKGIVNNDQIQSLLYSYHALYMPTLNENFGHSILESFAAGCLVVISDQTPWNNLKSLDIGYNVAVYGDRVAEELVSALNELAEMDEETINARGLKAWSFAHFYLFNNANLAANRGLFE